MKKKNKLTLKLIIYPYHSHSITKFLLFLPLFYYNLYYYYLKFKKNY